MLRKKIILALLVVYLTAGAGLVWAQNIDKIEPFKKEDRVLILAPHPDDESIACAGIIQQAKKAGAEIRLVYLTNGDNNEFAFIVYEKRLTFKKGEFIHMGQVRRQEAIKAMKLLGVDESKLVFLGYPDYGTFAIFTKYWQKNKPFRSMFTRVTNVPYKNDLSFGAPYVGGSILNDLEKIILETQPTKIFVSHPADINVDHKALYLFLQVSLWNLRNKIPQPKVYAYLVHSAGWPKPRHYHPELKLEPPKSFMDWLKLDLTPEELERKRQSILCYKSQTESSAFYLLSFARQNELFGDYPEIELSRQVSLKERAPAFFGFSKMYAGSSSEDVPADNNLIEGEGEAGYAVVDNYLLIRATKDKGLTRRLNLILYIFGFSGKTDFTSMPKIRVLTRRGKFRVYDGKRMINPQGTRLNLSPDGLVLRIPLTMLGDPDFILTSVKAYGGKLSPAATGFRRIVIK
jgi:LmbE family N-acetylglucosaminyl deacetylase